MQYLNLDDNEFLNLRLANPKLAKRKLLPNIKRRRKKVLDKKILTNPKYSAECLKKASMIRFASNEAREEFLKKCSKEKESLIFQDKKIGKKILDASQKQKMWEAVDNKDKIDLINIDSQPINPVDEGGVTTIEPPLDNPPAPVSQANKKGTQKFLLYGAIGIAVLLIGNKYF